MIVPSFRFLLFCLTAAIVFNLSTATGWRRSILLGCNLILLASFADGVQSLVPYAVFMALGFIAQFTVGPGVRQAVFAALLSSIMIVFFWLKRYTFIPGWTYIQFPYVLAGLSYVFFRVVHLIVDRYQGAIEQPVGMLEYLNYTLNFTSLVSGPIQRYQEYRRSEESPPPLNPAICGSAIERIITGYFKVAVVSVVLAFLQHQAIDRFAASATLSSRVENGMLILAIYPIYLYFNFSGYMDVVVGVARFFRIELPENFNRPFTSLNFLEFWSRWHITLSAWLKAYVYNPLMALSLRRIVAPVLAPYIAVLAYFVTFFLVGLWHGQTSEFIFFGLLQGGGVALNKLFQVHAQLLLSRRGYRTLAANSIYRACSRGLTFTWFAFTLLWFWSNWRQISQFYEVLSAPPVPAAMICIGLFAIATMSLAAMDIARRTLKIGWRERLLTSRYFRTAWATALAVVTVVTAVLGESSAPDIVYKTF